MSSRDAILTRIREATSAAPEPAGTATPTGTPSTLHPGPGPDTPAAPPARPDTPAAPPTGHDALVDLLAENLADYRARVHRAAPAEVPTVIASLLTARGSHSVAVPPGLPPEWLTAVSGPTLHHDTPEHPLTARELDAISSVVTACAVAVASTGTIVLDAGEAQGRRVLTLAPDHHVCVIRTTSQVVRALSQALPRLPPTRPLTWISGPSATSDIELTRVEGVHGPRTLDVILTP